MKLIALSGKRRSGKTALGNVLKEKYGYHPISIAEPLKNMVSGDFELNWDQTDGVFKESPTQYKDGDKFLTPRDIMIKVGAFYRSFDKDFWVKRLFEQIREVPQAQMWTYVVTDVRFKNEMEWMKRHKALKVRLERDEQFTGPNINDLSETDLDDYKEFDICFNSEINKYSNDLNYIAARIHDIASDHD